MAVNYKQWLEILFPPSPDIITLRTGDTSIFTTATAHTYNDILYALPYQNPPVRAAIHLAKFHHHRLALDLLAQALVINYQRLSTPPVVLPIPLSRRRRQTRGYNQVEEIIKRAQKIDPHLTYRADLLIRTRHTTPQSELKRADRLTNLEDAFAWRGSRNNLPVDTPLLLIDDVATTGTTLKVASAVIKKEIDNPLICFALAH